MRTLLIAPSLQTLLELLNRRPKVTVSKNKPTFMLLTHCSEPQRQVEISKRWRKGPVTFPQGRDRKAADAVFFPGALHQLTPCGEGQGLSRSFLLVALSYSLHHQAPPSAIEPCRRIPGLGTGFTTHQLENLGQAFNVFALLSLSIKWNQEN